jgi:hypothetical protein
MDSTYNYVSPDLVMGNNTFGDDENLAAYDPSFFLGTTTLPNEPLPFLAEGASFPVPVDFSNTQLGTPPMSGFDGYLEGNIDFDENLFNMGDLSWDTDMYNQTFAMGMDDFAVPPPPSTASESQGLSPTELYLPYTPPGDLTFTPSMPSPSTNASPSSSHQQPDRKPTASTGPKYVPLSTHSTSSSKADPHGPRRQLRKLIKPETCPVCGKGHAQIRERDRHIITQHYDEAVRMGLNVNRAECSLCDQTFRRKDHLTRHMKRRHGW